MADLPAQSPKMSTPAAKAALETPGERKALPGKKKSSAKNKILIIALLSVAVFVIGTLLVLRMFSGNKTVVVNPPKPTPTVIPRPTVTTDVVLGEPSIYANDPQILELEATIKALKAEIDSDDLKESELTPPSLITGIRF